MTVIEFGKRFSPNVHFDEEVNTISVNQEPQIIEPPKELTLLERNIETIKVLSFVLSRILEQATIDLDSKRLLQMVRSIVYSQEIANKASESVQTNDEPERA